MLERNRGFHCRCRLSLFLLFAGFRARAGLKVSATFEPAASPTAEQPALGKLLANWNSVMAGRQAGQQNNWRFEPRMNTDGHGLRSGNLTREIIGCAMEVLNTLGHGLLEKPYENALVVEFGLRGVRYAQQPRYSIEYKGVTVGDYIPDLIVADEVAVDTKVIEHITDHELGRMLNYLKITKLKVGLILNFKRAKLEWKRVSL